MEKTIRKNFVSHGKDNYEKYCFLMAKTIRRIFGSSWKIQLGKIILFPHGKDNKEK